MLEKRDLAVFKLGNELRHLVGRFFRDEVDNFDGGERREIILAALSDITAFSIQALFSGLETQKEVSKLMFINTETTLEDRFETFDAIKKERQKNSETC